MSTYSALWVPVAWCFKHKATSSYTTEKAPIHFQFFIG